MDLARLDNAACNTFKNWMDKTEAEGIYWLRVNVPSGLTFKIKPANRKNRSPRPRTKMVRGCLPGNE